jgi:hypothetical protein
VDEEQATHPSHHTPTPPAAAPSDAAPGSPPAADVARAAARKPGDPRDNGGPAAEPGDFDPARSPRARGGVEPGACLAPEGALPPDAGRALRVGLRYLKQMSERALAKIEAERRVAPFASFEDFYLRTRVEYPVAENLIRAGAFDGLEPDRTELLWRLPVLHDRLEALSGSAGARPGQLRAFFTAPERAGLSHQWSVEDRVRNELELLSLTVTCHPLELYREQLRRLGVRASFELPRLGDEVPVTVAGVYERAQNPWMRSGKRTMFLTLEDAYGLFECVCFESKLPKIAPVVARATYFLVRGRLQNNRKRGLAIVVDEIFDLEEVLARIERRGTPAHDKVGGGRRPARLGQPVERPTFAEHKLLVAERKEVNAQGLGRAGGGNGGDDDGTSSRRMIPIPRYAWGVNEEAASFVLDENAGGHDPAARGGGNSGTGGGGPGGERKSGSRMRGRREEEVYGDGSVSVKKRPPGAGTTAIPKKVG